MDGVIGAFGGDLGCSGGGGGWFEGRLMDRMGKEGGVCQLDFMRFEVWWSSCSLYCYCI